MRAVGLELLEDAPVRLRLAAPVAAAPEVVFRELTAEPGLWAGWFPGLSEAGYQGPGPHGVGARRFARMGDTVYRETVLAWDTPTRWAYRVDESNDGLLDALVEEWVVEADGDGSTVRWTFAAAFVDPSASAAVVEPVIGAVFAEAMANLSRRLTGEGRVLGPVGSELLREDERTRVWVLRLAPGERSSTHRHELDHLLVQVAGDRIAVIPEPDSEGPFRSYLAAEVVPGAVAHVRKGGVETAYNLGRQPYLEVIVELKG